jgi:sec-independent protein translocase protein TatA
MVLPHIGAPELIIVLVIIIILFGVGRISKIGREMGGAISAFRKGIKENDKVEEEEKTS